MHVHVHIHMHIPARVKLRVVCGRGEQRRQRYRGRLISVRAWVAQPLAGRRLGRRRLSCRR